MPSNHHRTVSRTLWIVLFLFCSFDALKLTIFCLACPAIRASDAGLYWRLGEQVSQGDLWMLNHPIAFRTPGFPWFLGLLQATGGKWAWCLAVAAQYFAVWLTTLIIGWWTWRTTKRPTLAVWSVAICCVSVARPCRASVLLTETFFSLSMTLTLVFLSAPGALRSLKSNLLVAFLLGISCMIRPAAAALMPAWLVAFYLSTADDKTWTWQSQFKKLICALSLILLLLGPWMVRNSLVFQRTTLTVFLGRELWITTFGPGQPAALTIPESEASRRLQKLVLSSGEFTQWDGNWTVSGRLTEAGLSDVDADELMREVSTQAIIRNPFRAIARGVVRAIDFWRSVFSRSMTFYEDEPADGIDLQENWNQPTCEYLRTRALNAAWESRLLGVEVTSAMALCGLVGLWLSPHTWRFGAVITTAIWGMAILTSAVEYPSYRYRMVLEPAMIVSALAGWNVLFDVLLRGTRSLWQDHEQISDSN